MNSKYKPIGFASKKNEIKKSDIEFEVRHLSPYSLYPKMGKLPFSSYYQYQFMKKPV